MPLRSEHELDPVALHNPALMNMEQNPTEGFEKLQFLIQHNPFPPETFPNLLLPYVKYDVIEVFFTARQHSLLCRAQYYTHSKSVRPSVRLPVRHTLALCQNDSSYDHAVFTAG